MRKKGLFIVTEGVDGTGKSTTLQYLLRLTNKKNIANIMFTREPGGTKFGAVLRKWFILSHRYRLDKITKAYLFAAARRDHVEHVIKPALADNETVICDRYLLSSIAYQGYLVNRPSIRQYLNSHHPNKYWSYRDLNQIRQINHRACDGVQPDLTVYFNAKASLINYRLSKRRRETSKYDTYDRHMQQYKFCQRLKRRYWIGLQSSPGRKLVINAADDPKKRALEIFNTIRSLRIKQKGLGETNHAKQK